MGFCCSSSVAVCSHPAPDRRFLAPSRGGGRSHPVVSPFSVNLFSSPRPCQARGGAVRDPSAATRSAAGAEPEAGTVCGAGPPPGAGAAAPQVLHHHLQVGAGPPPMARSKLHTSPKSQSASLPPQEYIFPSPKSSLRVHCFPPSPQKKVHCVLPNCIVVPPRIAPCPPQNASLHPPTPKTTTCIVSPLSDIVLFNTHGILTPKKCIVLL